LSVKVTLITFGCIFLLYVIEHELGTKVYFVHLF